MTSRSVNPPQVPGLSLREVIDLPCVQAGRPRVHATPEAVDRVVRWAHVSELQDIASLLRGDELVLTTGIGLPTEDTSLRRYIRDLADRRVAGLVIELGRRFERVPGALLDEARLVGLPVVTLAREVRFVEITEAIHTHIMGAQLEALRRSELVHERFTALTVDGAGLTTIVEVIAELLDQPVVLENLAHQVVTIAGNHALTGDLLEAYEQRSRSVRVEASSTVMGSGEVWTVVPVAARGERWGRLVAVAASPAAVTPDTLSVLERGAAALAVNRLSERDETAVILRSHQEVLGPLLEGAHRSDAALHTRARTLGVPLVDRSLVGVSVVLQQPSRGTARSPLLEHDDVEQVIAAAQRHLRVLIESVDPHRVRLLASFPLADDPAERLRGFASRLRRELRSGPNGARGVVCCVGSVVQDLRGVKRSLAEADQVAAAAPAAGRSSPYLDLLDVRLPGLIHTLRDDPRLQAFVERELGPLLRVDHPRGHDLLRTLQVYLEVGANKTRAAEGLHLSRPALYARLRVVEETLDADLDDPLTCHSLHVALLGLSSLRGALDG